MHTKILLRESELVCMQHSLTHPFTHSLFVYLTPSIPCFLLPPPLFYYFFPYSLSASHLRTSPHASDTAVALVHKRNGVLVVCEDDRDRGVDARFQGRVPVAVVRVMARAEHRSHNL